MPASTASAALRCPPPVSEKQTQILWDTICSLLPVGSALSANFCYAGNVQARPCKVVPERTEDNVPPDGRYHAGIRTTIAGCGGVLQFAPDCHSPGFHDSKQPGSTSSLARGLCRIVCPRVPDSPSKRQVAQKATGSTALSNRSTSNR